jgi:hypothetical protein
MKKLPGKTVERLSKYRRASVAGRKPQLHLSHELAALLHITSAGSGVI